MKTRTKLLLAGGALAVTAIGGTAVAVAAVGGDDSEAPITGAALERASAAALEHTGQGRVTETEVGDEDSYYEVEVTLDSGGQVDVQLDEQFRVVGADPDDDSREDGPEAD